MVIEKLTLSSVSPNLIFSVLAEFGLWELSIVSSLSLYSILVQHACNDHAWLTSEIIRVKFAYHFRINYDLNLETAEFLELGLCDFGETLLSARH